MTAAEADHPSLRTRSTPMRPIRPIRPALPVLAALLLAGCDGRPVDLARDIAAARGDCDEAALRAGTEECVRMFQRYAEMGTEAMHTYIGAMKAFDQALRRMPPPQFDTVGLGRALTPAEPYYGAAGGSSPHFPEGAAEGYGYDGEYAPYPDTYPQRYPDPYPYPGPQGEGYGGPARGLLLPPEERLRRPWLYEDDYYEYYDDYEYRDDYGYDGRYRPYAEPRYGPSSRYPGGGWYADPPPERPIRSPRVR